MQPSKKLKTDTFTCFCGNLLTKKVFICNKCGQILRNQEEDYQNIVITKELAEDYQNGTNSRKRIVDGYVQKFNTEYKMFTGEQKMVVEKVLSYVSRKTKELRENGNPDQKCKVSNLQSITATAFIQAYNRQNDERKIKLNEFSLKFCIQVRHYFRYQKQLIGQQQSAYEDNNEQAADLDNETSNKNIKINEQEMEEYFKIIKKDICASNHQFLQHLISIRIPEQNKLHQQNEEVQQDNNKPIEDGKDKFGEKLEKRSELQTEAYKTFRTAFQNLYEINGMQLLKQGKKPQNFNKTLVYIIAQSLGYSNTIKDYVQKINISTSSFTQIQNQIYEFLQKIIEPYIAASKISIPSTIHLDLLLKPVTKYKADEEQILKFFINFVLPQIEANNLHEIQSDLSNTASESQLSQIQQSHIQQSEKQSNKYEDQE